MYLLTVENIDYIIDMPGPEKPKKLQADWNCVFMLESMADSLAAEHEGEQNAKKIIGRLENDFGGVSLVKVLSLVNRFLSTKMNEGGSVNEHIMALNKSSPCKPSANNAF